MLLVSRSSRRAAWNSPSFSRFRYLGSNQRKSSEPQPWEERSILHCFVQELALGQTHTSKDLPEEKPSHTLQSGQQQAEHNTRKHSVFIQWNVKWQFSLDTCYGPAVCMSHRNLQKATCLNEDSLIPQILTARMLEVGGRRVGRTWQASNRKFPWTLTVWAIVWRPGWGYVPSCHPTSF